MIDLNTALPPPAALPQAVATILSRHHGHLSFLHRDLALVSHLLSTTCSAFASNLSLLVHAGLGSVIVELSTRLQSSS